MPSPLRNRLPDPVPSLEGFEGIINTRRSHDIGYGGLTIGGNVEVTNEKRLLRRNGYTRVRGGAYAGLYGSLSQRAAGGARRGSGERSARRQRGGAGIGLDDGHTAGSKILPPTCTTSVTRGPGGVAAQRRVDAADSDDPHHPGVAAIDTAPWIVTPFNLGKTYTRTRCTCLRLTSTRMGARVTPSES